VAGLVIRAAGVLGAATVIVMLFLSWFEYEIVLPPVLEEIPLPEVSDERTGWAVFSVRDIALVAVAVVGAVAIIGTAFYDRGWLPVLGFAMALAGIVIVITALASPPTPDELELPPPPEGVGEDLESDLNTSALVAPYVALAGFGDGFRQSCSVLTTVAVPTLKQCPDCAKRVPAAAHVCRFCGYRFEQGASS
jgi:hypothetical protein